MLPTTVPMRRFHQAITAFCLMDRSSLLSRRRRHAIEASDHELAKIHGGESSYLNSSDISFSFPTSTGMAPHALASYRRKQFSTTFPRPFGTNILLLYSSAMVGGAACPTWYLSGNCFRISSIISCLSCLMFPMKDQVRSLKLSEALGR